MIRTFLISLVLVPAMILICGLFESANARESVAETVPVAGPSAPMPVRAGLILISLYNHVTERQSAVLFTPEGKEVDRFELGAAGQSEDPDGKAVCGLTHGRLSPDGQRLAAFKVNPFRPDNRGPWVIMHLWVFDLENKKGPLKALRPKIKNPSLAWGADGSKLFVSGVDPEKTADLVEMGRLVPIVSSVYDFKTQSKTPLGLPSGHEVVDVSCDGKSLLTRTRPGQEWDLETAHVLALDTFQSRRVGPQPFEPMRFSPDGKEVIGYCPGKKDNHPVPGRIAIASAGNGMSSTIGLPPRAIRARFACWSPDGKRIAYEWSGPRGTPEIAGADQLAQASRANQSSLPCCRVTVADFDGVRAKTIFQCEPDQLIYGVDWK